MKLLRIIQSQNILGCKKRFSSHLSDREYHQKANDYLENLTEYLEEVGDKLDSNTYDVLFNVQKYLW